ncbi:uncharacterized protein LOC100902812, partial [Galendromus occidentalis]|uniref:Uncharacterized protein LOC100902812 n=1 Tax=Galendromus occidentalis TaxID=34638 RepID=A0AAJ6VUT0_9ACAR
KLRTRFTRKLHELEEALKTIENRASRRSKVDREWLLVDEIFEQLKEENKIITPLLLKCAPEQFEAAAERAFDYEDAYFRVYFDVKALRAEETRSAEEQKVTDLSTSFAKLGNFNKHFKIPKFSGDYRKFREWWQIFDAHVHKKTLDPVEKYSYLKQSLVGPAAAEIAHLEFSADQYQVAMDTIEAKFGAPKDAEKEHVQQLQRLFQARDLHINDKLFKFISSLSQNVKALIALGKTYESLSTMVTPNVLNALPVQMRESFSRKNFENLAKADADNELKLLLEYLDREAAIKRACQTLDPQTDTNARGASYGRGFVNNPGNYQGARARHNSYRPGRDSVAFLAKDSEVDHSCLFCAGTKHESKACKKPLSVKERREVCERSNACFKCLHRNHHAKNCRVRNVKCDVCGRAHYPIICEKREADGEKVKAFSATVASGTVDSTSNEIKYFQTGLVWVLGRYRKKVFRFILDSGAERSYVSRKVTQALALDPIGRENLATLTIGGEISDYKNHDVYHLRLRGRFNSTSTVAIPAVEVPEIAKGEFPIMRDGRGLFPLADHGGSLETSTVDILVGQDALASLLKGEERIFDNKVVATSTIFGWVLSGRGEPEGELHQEQMVFLASSRFQPGTRLKSSETINLSTLINRREDVEYVQVAEGPLMSSDTVDSTAEAELEKFFKNNIQRLNENRYMVSLPFNDKLRFLGDNENIARGSLSRFLRKARDKKDLLRSVDEEIQKYVQMGYAEPATPKKPGELVHYLPILPVIKRTATGQIAKVRVVKDAGARRKDEAALNDVLHCGANLLPDIIKVLLRFRKQEIAIVADIQKAFLQYKIHPDHRTFLRFFWPIGVSENPHAPIKELWSTVLDFGIVSSPFIHCAGLKYHIRQLKRDHPEKAGLLEDIENHFYVDDLVTSADSAQSGLEICRFMLDSFNEGGFRLQRWATNSAELGRRMEATAEIEGLQVNYGQTDFRFLGLGWDLGSDQLHIPVQAAVSTLRANQPTKRTLLKGTAQVFDPLGLIAPITIKAKTLIQRLWIAKRSWDEPLGGEELEAFSDFVSVLEQVNRVRVDRNTLSSPSAPRRTELHAFCDASLAAYGVVVYIREVSDQEGPKSHWLAAKARVAPLRAEFTIHRLELISAVLAARLVQRVREYFNYHFDSIFFWSDNSPTLHWIRDAPSRWKPFVANRIREIQSLSDPSAWNYVASADNPADLLSRGVSVTEGEAMDMWLRGPPWLSRNGRPEKPHQLNELFDNELKVESEKSRSACLSARAAASEVDVFQNCDRVSSWSVVVNSTARILRWLAIVRGARERAASGAPVSTAEAMKAEEAIIKSIQKRHFDLEINSNCKEVPKERNDNAVRLLIRFFHEKRLYHVGGVAFTLNALRRKFYILSARRTTRSVLRDCVDHAGPIPFRNAMNEVCKGYILLFVCSATRAVHLELVPDMSTEQFLLSLRKFLNRFRSTTKIISDNGRSFVRAAKELKILFDHARAPRVQQHLVNQSITWEFITARAPWQGGWYERMVQTIKRPLRRILGKNTLSFRELEVVLSDVEALVNERPLTAIQTDPNEIRALSPAELVSANNLRVPLPEVECEPKDPSAYKSLVLSKRWMYYQSIMKSFRKRFKEEYLQYLRSAHLRTPVTRRSLQPGDICLLKDSDTSRNHWPLCRVLSLSGGERSDRLKRSCLIKLATGQTYSRPIQLLYPLEV